MIATRPRWQSPIPEPSFKLISEPRPLSTVAPPGSAFQGLSIEEHETLTCRQPCGGTLPGVVLQPGCRSKHRPGAGSHIPAMRFKSQAQKQHEHPEVEEVRRPLSRAKFFEWSKRLWDSGSQAPFICALEGETTYPKRTDPRTRPEHRDLHN